MLGVLKPIEHFKDFPHFLPDADANRIKIPSIIAANKSEELRCSSQMFYHYYRQGQLDVWQKVEKNPTTNNPNQISS